MSVKSNPSAQYAVVTPSDTVNFDGDQLCRGLYIGGTGAITVVDENDVTTLFSALPAGSLLPIRCKRVNATATDATLIVALF